MSKKNMAVNNLNYEIQTILIEKEIREYESHPTKNKIMKIKNQTLLFLPIILGISTFITKSDMLLLLTTLSVTAEITNVFINSRMEQKSFLYDKKMSSNEHEKYFNSDYKRIYEVYSKEHEQEIEEKKIRDNIKLVTNDYLNKEETKERLLFELDRYYDTYDLPTLYLNDKEIDELINKSYEFFESNDLKEKYYDYMSSVVRLTLARALVNKDEEIKLYDFLYNLSYINLFEPNLSLESVKNLQEDINKINIIDIKRLKRVK